MYLRQIHPPHPWGDRDRRVGVVWSALCGFWSCPPRAHVRWASLRGYAAAAARRLGSAQLGAGFALDVSALAEVGAFTSVLALSTGRRRHTPRGAPTPTAATASGATRAALHAGDGRP